MYETQQLFSVKRNSPFELLPSKFHDKHGTTTEPVYLQAAMMQEKFKLRDLELAAADDSGAPIDRRR